MLGFKKYSSRIKRVNIPVPSFEYVHKSWIAGQKGTTTLGLMIGRDRIIEKLKTWLIKEKSNGGSYLITGYRGMGKTCFVDRVLYELVGKTTFWTNLIGFLTFIVIGISVYSVKCENVLFSIPIAGLASILLVAICKQYLLKEKFKKIKYRIKAAIIFTHRHKQLYDLWGFLKAIKLIWTGLTPKEWDRINNLVYGANTKNKRYSHICVNVNLGQEILDERSILCVLTSQLYDKYRAYIFSPIANVEMWVIYTILIALSVRLCDIIQSKDCPSYLWTIGILVPICLVGWNQIYTLFSLRLLRKRIDAELKTSEGVKMKYENTKIGTNMEYTYPIANIRDIESQLIAILDRINAFPLHPTFYFVFDELDKIEVPIQQRKDALAEYSNEKYLSTGGTSRKRKFMVMHLLANMKYFTTTAKAKFIFIAGREMYDGYLADLTDRESAISSLFNGVIYVESFCKNEKSDKDVMYNTEAFITRQLLPRQFIADKVMDSYIECKIKDITYTNIDINLKLYYEYLTLVYADNILGAKLPEQERQRYFEIARAYIDKTIGLLYHFTAYLYHISNGSPKKMRMNFENRIRPLRNIKEFQLHKKHLDWDSLNGVDLDIHIPERCKYLLSFGEKEQRIIGFIHYISFPVNHIITDANQFGDKLLVSACFLINHLYKHHSGGFSWRNIEQTPELLEVYKVPEFRGFINSILTYLMQTHIIQIPCGLYQFKFRKQISEEISLASKVSEEISAIFNFTLDESQSVKRHYMEIQERHLLALKNENVTSPHSVAGFHHILADLYMADEEYNQAIFEYQTALNVLKKQVKTTNEDSHQATFTLAYIRNMLKLGAAFEKRKTYTSAYNTYNEIIDYLFRFREFDEEKFGLSYVVTPINKWPYQEALLYNDGIRIRSKKPVRSVVPKWLSNKDSLKGLEYKTMGSRMISDFSHQMNPKKHTVIQRLAMLEDTQIVYQALLAKLFINEKIELGGITRSNLDMIEGEYQYIHLTTNEKEKFLISTDFFRRLGDIMFYKNGLIGFNYTSSESELGLKETFADSLYFWAFNIETEINDYCAEHKCYELREIMLKDAKTLTKECLSEIQNTEDDEGIKWNGNNDSGQMIQFWTQRKKRLKKLPVNKINKCNKTRKEMWRKKRTMPCFACKYYNRSLRIIVDNLFGIDSEELKYDSSQKLASKTILLLKLIVKNGSAKSWRQNYMVQFAEVLDCLGNTILSCSDFKEDQISATFLSKFLHDAHVMNEKMDEIMDIEDFILLNKQEEQLSKLEVSILYYWEAYICFRYGREQKKAYGSLKKILRMIQNYLRVAEKNNDLELRTKCKTCIGEFLNEVKNRLIKQALICLYSHYNFINTVEIQQLKWIFYTQMYENISLNRLSLFPDVEEIMLIYYDIIRLCIVDKESCNSANNCLLDIRSVISACSSDFFTSVSMKFVQFTCNNIEERNEDFNNRLIGIYNNISLGALRHENTVYERVLSLRMKMILNRHILFIAFPKLQTIWNNPTRESTTYVDVFIEYLITSESSLNFDDSLWMRFFPDERFCYDKEPKTVVNNRLHLLEFLIKDSIYCLTSILETITPYTTTTLFTHSFIGSIYRSLNKWNILFDELFMFYKFFDENRMSPNIFKESNLKRETLFQMYDCNIEAERDSYCNHMYCQYNNGHSGQKWQSNCPYYRNTNCAAKANRFEKIKQFLYSRMEFPNVIETSNVYHEIWGCNNLSDRFFGSILSAIDKHNIQYTLTNYSGEMALKSYRSAKEVHREGRAYKEMISRMYYLDDDLKNDTIQFDLAIERFKINSEHIDNSIKSVLETLTDSIYDIENFCIDNETRGTLCKRFPDLFWNVSEEQISKKLRE